MLELREPMGKPWNFKLIKPLIHQKSWGYFYEVKILESFTVNEAAQGDGEFLGREALEKNIWNNIGR